MTDPWTGDLLPGGAILLVDKKRHAGSALHFGLPGGGAEYNEDPRTTCEREAFEETGLRITPGHPLVHHWVPARTDADGTEITDGYNWIFDCGQYDGSKIVIDETELVGYAFVLPRDLGDYVRPYTQKRISAALEYREALRQGALPFPFLTN
ncbi:NUDIX domain-containing protein [Streptomyces noursei]|nr:NUDIX hydrolase [Streptomyces noursei]